MGKFEECYDICEGLYVNDGHTLTQIKAETEVSFTTLTKWKDDGGWAGKRMAALRINQDIKTKLKTLKLKLVDEALINGDPQKVYALVWLMRSEGSMTKGQEESEQTTGELTPETLRKIKEEIYGIIETSNEPSTS